MDVTRQRRMEPHLQFEDLLKPCVANGKLVCEPESLGTIRDRVRHQLASFHDGVKRLKNPHRYPVGLESNLQDLKSKLVLEARGLVDGSSR
jgi:nicotinate phosphoribosyltransferase